MRSNGYKKYKREKKIYDNRVFSYANKLLETRNYSRKNFKNTWNKLVVFRKCIFEQTIISVSKFENCLFDKCSFSKFEIRDVVFKNVTFVNCSFNDILFNRCTFDSVVFEENIFANVVVFPPTLNQGIGFSTGSANDISNELETILSEALSHKYIRISNTLFKKKKSHLPSSDKLCMKKLTKKEGDKLGLSKKQRLEENKSRKKKKNEWLLQSYEKAQLGENRVIDKGIINYLNTKYSEEELIKGLRFAIDNINFSFSELSYLLKYIDKGIK